MKLTDTAIRKTKCPEGKTFTKLSDGKGLHLKVEANGGKYWQFRYRRPSNKKENTLSFGTYPEVSLSQARKHRDDARALIAAGTDPSDARKEESAKRSGALSFESIGREWLAMQSAKWKPTTAKKQRWLLETFIFPFLGNLPPDEITPIKLLETLRKIEARGTHETAKRAKQVASQVFRFAIATGRGNYDPSPSLRGALSPVVSKNHAAITDPQKVGALLRAIDGYEGSVVTICALRLAPHVFVRPGELRGAEWSEIDFENAVWRIPASRMKMGTEHIVPLSRQAIDILKTLHPITGNGQHLFPGVRHRNRPMSENTINGALRALGFAKGEMTGHGFRSMASTLLNELGWKPDLIERQLAHEERNKVRAAYNKAQYLDERRKMMQAWSDYLSTLKEGAQVVPIRKAE